MSAGLYLEAGWSGQMSPIQQLLDELGWNVRVSNLGPNSWQKISGPSPSDSALRASIRRGGREVPYLPDERMVEFSISASLFDAESDDHQDMGNWLGNLFIAMCRVCPFVYGSISYCKSLPSPTDLCSGAVDIWQVSDIAVSKSHYSEKAISGLNSLFQAGYSHSEPGFTYLSASGDMNPEGKHFQMTDPRARKIAKLLCPRSAAGLG